MSSVDALRWGGRVMFGLSAAFVVVAVVLFVAAAGLVGFAAYRRDGELLLAAAMLAGAALFGIFIAGAGILVSRMGG